MPLRDSCAGRPCHLGFHVRDARATIAVFTIAILMAIWTWNSWPDVLVDFGKELYIAWQLSRGAHLYGNVAYYMGPLSPWINGTLFTLFGAHLRTLVIANLCVLAGVILLVMHLARIVAGESAAAISGLLLVLLFAFNQYTPNGNYNFVCPYEHEYTHGMLLCLLALAALWRAMTTGRLRWLFIAGLGCGCVALTRGEVFIAVSGAIGCAMLLNRSGRSSWFALASGIVLPILIAFALLAWHLPVREALLGIAGSWPSMFNRSLTSLPFYRKGMGMLHPIHSAQLLMWGTLQWALWLLPALLISLWRRTPKDPASTRSIAIATFAIYALATAAVWRTLATTGFFRPLTLSAIIALVLATRYWWTHRTPLSVFRLSLTLFSALLLLKMVLYARIHQYGFAVAMPATLVTAVMLGVALPRALDVAGFNGWIFRAGFAAVALVVVGTYLTLSNDVMCTKTVWVGHGADGFWADTTRGPDVNICLNDLAHRTTPSQTVLVVPEGAMLNYLARRAEPTQYANFNPPDLAIFGPSRILKALQSHPANWVVVAHKDTSEFGVQFFGKDYAQSIAHWIQANYKVTRTIGQIPLRPGTRFGISIMAKTNDE